jgi:hypothetical protein
LLSFHHAKSAGLTVAALIFLPPQVQVKPVITDTLGPDWNGNEMRLHLAIEAISVHAQIGGCVLGPDDSWKETGSFPC